MPTSKVSFVLTLNVSSTYPPKYLYRPPGSEDRKNELPLSTAPKRKLAKEFPELATPGNPVSSELKKKLPPPVPKLRKLSRCACTSPPILMVCLPRIQVRLSRTLNVLK